jgi:hypothetical protein
MTDDIEDTKLAALTARTRQLPREIDPPADAWPAIEAQIEKLSGDGVRGIPQRRISVWQRPAFLAAAAVFLVAASSVITALTLGRFQTTHKQIAVVPATGPAPVKTRHSGSTPSNLAEFAAVETDYINSANQLSSLLETEKTALSPETVAKLRKSLEIIDGAIIEARRALAADPADRALIEMLNTTYNQKLDLLRRATEMGRS